MKRKVSLSPSEGQTELFDLLTSNSYTQGGRLEEVREGTGAAGWPVRGALAIRGSSPSRPCSVRFAQRPHTGAVSRTQP